MYVNVGVKDFTPFSGNKDIPTKKALKDAIAANPANVYMYGTSDFTPFSGTADKADIGVKYSVTGPNPYTSRKWYAVIEKGQNGKITVK